MQNPESPRHLLINVGSSRDYLKDFFKTILTYQSSVEEIFPGELGRSKYLPMIEKLLSEVCLVRRGLVEFPKRLSIEVDLARPFPSSVGNIYTAEMSSAKMVGIFPTALEKYIDQRTKQKEEIGDFSQELRILKQIRDYEASRGAKVVFNFLRLGASPEYMIHCYGFLDKIEEKNVN